MYISTQHNTIFEFTTGDGFRTLALPNLIPSNSIVVSRRMMIKQYYEDTNAITIHSVKKFIEKNKYNKLKLIIIDTVLPRVTSQAHKALLELCKGKQIVFLHAIRDTGSLSSAMELMSVTKNCKLKSVVFNRRL